MIEKAKDELTTRRQKKCAESREGHQFPFEDGHGVCVKCLLRVDPPQVIGKYDRCPYCENPASMTAKEARCGFISIHKKEG